MGLCAYETAKVVAIRDKRLASLRYLFVVVISAYVIIFELLGSGGYLTVSPTVGVVRFSLQHPTLSECDPSDLNCRNDFAPLNELPYCQQYDSNDLYAGNIYPCEIYESINAQIVSEKSIAVITRASVINQTQVCEADAMTCQRTYSDESEEHRFYTAQSERFTILFDHAVTASHICSGRHSRHPSGTHYTCSAESSQFPGRLHSKDSELCKLAYQTEKSYVSYRGKQQTDGAPCFIEPNHTATNQDFFTLDTILRASGVDIDDCNVGTDNADSNSTITNTGSCQTYRDTGATLLLNIYWTDFAPYVGLVDPAYYYSPQLIAGSSFKQYIPFYKQYRSQRTLLNAHGIKIAVLLGGEFHTFNMLSFLITLTTAVGLLAVATTIVDLLMLYVLPEKERYQEAKYESTEEFERRNLVPSALNQLIFRSDRRQSGEENDGAYGRAGDEANELQDP
eukprot:CAMPEP_0197721198 /NCGR_PEP_ID=MMETSP1434-20131217/4334_1 /TAXON_ID=265543 /ORGANISM="Minutocellus polymorphus, Strain CCMP3303" /LENGTH=451 /DNA_ID=CAMNT_0043306173 /DNA_START=74 /DNA_END=1425 /DNA_ORIENTATION=-